MYNKTIHIKMAIFLALLGFATAQLRAEIPIVLADTVFAGFGGGSVSGIVFGPTGETVILMHNAQPVEINIKTKQIVREFEKVPNYTEGESNFLYLKEKGWLINYARSTELNGITNFAGQVFWDITTGKIIMAKQIQIILSDGIKCFSFYTTNDRKYLGKYDVNTFKIVDSLDLSIHFPGDGLASCSTIGIIPNSNKVLLGVDRYAMYKDENDDWQKKYYLGELYIYDFDNKELKKIEIPYGSGHSSSEISKISVSEASKYCIVSLNYNPNGDTYYFIYDLNMNFLYNENSKTLAQKSQTISLQTSPNIYFIDDRYLIVPCLRNDISNELIYDIDLRKVTSFIDFFGGNRLTSTQNQIAMCNQHGVVGLIDTSRVSVIDRINKNSTAQSIQYKDSSLIINSSMNEKVDILITDYNGNSLQIQKDVFLQNGNNTIKINVPLGNGVYFCVIKTSAGSNSFKFMVSR